jgi:hypothetical protein
MGNAIAYLSGNTLTYQPGIFKRGTVGQNFASTLTGGYTWWNSVDVNSSQYLIYCDTYTTNATSESNATPSAWSTPDLTDTSLLNVINSFPELVGQPKFTSASSALTWLQQRNIYWLVKSGYENIITDGLVLSLDAGWTNSYGVTYVCGTAQENQTLTITAPSGYKFTKVMFASYGTPNGSCGNFTINNTCHSSTSVSVVEGYLLGQTGTISIPATNVNFGDPCPGTEKRLYVQAMISPTTWLDISGSGNTSTLINGPLFGENNGGYLDFDGTNDIATFGSKTLTDIGLISQSPTTIEAWVKFDSLNDYVHIVDGSDNCFHLAVESTAAGAGAYFWNGAAYHDSSLPGLTTGQWYHIVGVQETSLLKIYVNGVLLVNGTLNSGAGNLVLTGKYLALGYWQGQNTRYLNGNIAITRLYKKALSLAEIQQNFNAQCNRFGVSNNYVKAGLITYLDGSNLGSYPNSGTTWYDLSGNNNVGTLINGPTFDSTTKSIVFDGTNDYVNCGDIIRGRTTFSADALIKTTDTRLGVNQSYHNVSIFGTQHGGDISGDFAMTLKSGYLGFYHELGGYGHIDTGVFVADDTWKYITVTKSSSGNIRVYVNGTQVYTGNGFIDTIRTLDLQYYNWELGRAYWYGEDTNMLRYNGQIASHRLYNRDLTQTEILQNYYQGNIVTSNLLFYYDAGNLISYPKSGTSTKNLSSLSTNVGTLNNGVGFSSNNGGYFTFDGTDDNINIGTVGGYSNQMTCEAWFRTTSNASWKNMICGPIGDVIFTVNGNVINFGSQGNSPIPHTNYSNTVVNTGAWFHAAATYNGSTVNIYINGILDATYDRTGSQTPGNLRIGSNDNGAGEFYNGDLPIVRMYSTALSQSQIIQNFNSQKSRFGL